MDLTKTVADIMSTDLTVVSPNTVLEELEKLFTRRAIHHLPVEDANGIFLGIVSSGDLRSYKHFISSVLLEAQHIMTVDPITLSPSTPLREALTTFLDNRFRALPVVDSTKKLVGIITPYDFLALVLK